MTRIGPLQEFQMSSPRTEDPSNADLARMIQANHEDTSRKLDEASGRLRVLEHHLINPTSPEETLPIRTRDLEAKVKSIDRRHERLSKTAVAMIVTFIGSMLAAAGSWLWSRIEGRDPSQRETAERRTDR